MTGSALATSVLIALKGCASAVRAPEPLAVTLSPPFWLQYVLRRVPAVQ